MIKINIFIGVLLSAILYAAAIFIGLKINCGVEALVHAYQAYMRGYIFSAFLGVSSFLLSLLTFVVINLKEKMFDSKDYLGLYRSFNNMNEDDPLTKKGVYKPLRIITVVLVLAISCCIITSVLQFTLGFSSNKYVLIAPTFFPFLSISFMSLALYQMTQLIYQWLKSEGFIDES